MCSWQIVKHNCPSPSSIFSIQGAMILDMSQQFKTIGDRVKHAREAVGLNGPQLAGRIGVTKQAISAIESGKTKQPKPDHLLAIADATGFELRWLISERGPQTKKEAAHGRLDITGLSSANQAAIRAALHAFSQQNNGNTSTETG